MDMEGVIALLLGIPFGCSMVVLLGAMLFPSTRAALATWMHRPGEMALDGEVVSAQLESANAQLAALRGEVYALRCEVAAVSQALPGASRAAALSAGPMGQSGQ